MPFLHIFTTLSRAQIPENFGPLLAKVLSTAMRNKPIERVSVIVSPDQYMSLGTRDNIPLALVNLKSIGGVDLDDNRRTVKAVIEFIGSELGIEPSNIRMTFQNQSTDTVGRGEKLACDLMAPTEFKS